MQVTRNGRKPNGAPFPASAARVCLLLGLALLVACNACGTTKKVAKNLPDANPRDSTTFAYRAHDWHGFMVWSCGRAKPSGFLNLAALQNQESFEALVAHEGAHIRLAMSFPTCTAYKEWISEKQNALLSEAIAFCAQLHAHVRHGRRADSMLVALGRDLALAYPFNITPEMGRKKIRAVCP